MVPAHQVLGPGLRCAEATAARPGLAVVVLAVRHVRRPAPTLKQSQNLPGRLGPQAGGRRTFSSRPRKASTPGLRAAGAPPTACSAAIATMNCWRMPSVSPRPCPATVGGTVFVALCVRTSSCAVVPDRARRPLGRHGAPSHLPRPAGTPRHQGNAPAPALSSSPTAPAGHQANAAHRLIRRGRPVPQGTAPAPVLSSPTAPTGHRANVVHCLGRRGCPVPQGTKQRTSSPALSSSPTAPAGHQADAAHHLIRRGRPVPQGTAPAPVLSSPTAPAGHWADVALRLIRRGRPAVPHEGTAPARPVLSSPTALG